MKTIRWISLAVLVVLLMGTASGCGPAKEDLGVADVLDTPTTQETPQTGEEQTPTDPEPQDPAEDREPVSDKTPNDTPQPEQPEDPAPETPDTNPQPAPGTDPEPAPVEKENSGIPITFLSQNVRHSGTRMGVKGDGTGNDIYNRMRRFKSLVLAQDPDVIFYSEARKGAISFLTETDPYFTSTYTTHYRYENETQAEPLMWKTARFEPVKTGFFWLSNTPNVPSSYDGGETIVSWAILKVKGTDQKIYCASTHFRPGNNADITIPSMAQYHQVADEMDDDIYTFFGGDFNSHYRKSPYLLMMDWEKVVDLRDVAMYMYDDKLTTLGGMWTGTNVNYDAATENVHLMPEVKKEGSQIDYVMMKPNPHVAVDYYGFDYTTYDYPADDVKPGHISDHFGLVVKVRINTDADYSQYQKEPYDYGDKPMYFDTGAI